MWGRFVTRVKGRTLKFKGVEHLQIARRKHRKSAEKQYSIPSYHPRHSLHFENMAPRYLKKGSGATDSSNAAHANVSSIVKEVIDDIRENGDVAVRKYSAKFDKWSPHSFKLTKEEIENAMAAVPEQTIADIKEVQSNVRQFAQAQRDSIRDFEIETQPVGIVRPLILGPSMLTTSRAFS